MRETIVGRARLTGPSLDDVSPRKREILRVAARLFATRGYDATGIQDLGDEVGLGRGALYHHIGSKEELLYEISLQRPLVMVDFGKSLIAQDLPATEKLRRLSRQMMETLESNQDAATVFLADSRRLAEPHRIEIVKLRKEFEAIWTTVLQQGVDEQVFVPSHSLITKGILGLFNYSYVWFRPGGELSAAEVADLFADFIIRALTPVPGDIRET